MRRLAAFITIGLFYCNANAQTLVMPGDHPDPSVVKIGNKYYASATTSNWGPVFPIMESDDLLTWKTIANVFDTVPAWADFYFWAPEISYENGKVYVYYAAHKKGGNLCVGIASADKPGGPYKDHGPLICQEAGSIDAFPVRDKDGKLYLVWKEDANSVSKPTPIWAQQLNEERTALIGEKKELFRNDSVWEANLVEGVSMIKHGEYFYAIYAAAACCGTACTYGVGVARATSLFGPWEKDPANPVIKNNDRWVCPGHGTPVVKEGRNYFLFHAYDKTSNVFVGRQGVLQEFVFTNNHWISFVPENNIATAKTNVIVDEFDKPHLSQNWQWSVFSKPAYQLSKGQLTLHAINDSTASFLAQKTYTGNYEVLSQINISKSTANAGIAIIGDDVNYISATYKKGKIVITKMRDGKATPVALKTVPKNTSLFISLQVVNGKDIRFYYSINNKQYTSINKDLIDGTYLPPWDRAVRVGLFAAGSAAEKAVFENFSISSH